MKRCLPAICGILLGTPVLAAEPLVQGWTDADVGALRQSVKEAPEEGLPPLPTDTLDQAVATGDPARIDHAATDLALALARMHLLGVTPLGDRKEWHIVDTDDADALPGEIKAALVKGSLERFFVALRPQHSDYELLMSAYAQEQDPQRRATLAFAMERWRWMPRTLGSDYVLVNAATFEASRWRNGARIGTWPVVVGKTSSPTPAFRATITAVTFNPWWEIPANIVKESVGALIRRNPALARKRGYVWGAGRYRQRPGPDNALGRMKLVMPNPYHVYLHDTPSQSLFNKDVRAFSHGCVRVGDALGFAGNLLQGQADRARIDALVQSGKTSTVALANKLPVYVAYFTASSDATGMLSIQPDLYVRDQALSDKVAAIACTAQ